MDFILSNSKVLDPRKRPASLKKIGGSVEKELALQSSKLPLKYHSCQPTFSHFERDIH
ncbi:hypothetical protein BDZ97DRAFT_1862548, partial [Flammula alnicola]